MLRCGTEATYRKDVATAADDGRPGIQAVLNAARRPVPVAKRAKALWATVMAIAAGFGAAWAFVTGHFEWALVVALAALAVWGWVAAVLSEAELARRNRHPEIKVLPEVEGPSTGFVERQGRRYHRQTLLWIRVEVVGRGGEFTARFSDVEGAAHFESGEATMPGYRHHLAWEETLDKRCEIGFNGHARLLTACFFAEPRAFWFMLPRTELYGERHAASLVLVPSTQVTFRVEITDEASEHIVLRRAVVVVGEAGDITAFRLEEIEGAELGVGGVTGNF